LESLDGDVDINKAWETIRENIKLSAKETLGYYELKQHKPWLDESCSELLHQKKPAKFQRLQDPRQINGHNQKNVGSETAGYFRNKRGIF
jgi:hypothetical protein